ncbi:DUF4114 domain-containing protein [Undibacterium sp. Xuan67W]|uniref:DUF4114 domain-containing protein n=1 Tax=Undibacterium sp. Xuan67W TaxID=3413057 RepID=UPI003BF1079E
MNLKSLFAALVISLGVASSASAVPTAYGASGTPNPTLYSFVATTTGDVLAYFADSTAGYTNTLSLLVNGVDTGISGLNNHTSVYGQMLNFGTVNAGDSLVFRLNVLNNGDTWFSQKSLNSDGVNHIYSSSYAGDIAIPAGVYVAFEDLRNGGDYNYHDENFVFTNVSNAQAIPLPATPLLFGLGLGVLALVGKRRKKG